jgi:hypothetical protein
MSKKEPGTVSLNWIGYLSVILAILKLLGVNISWLLVAAPILCGILFVVAVILVKVIDGGTVVIRRESKR